MNLIFVISIDISKLVRLIKVNTFWYIFTQSILCVVSKYFCFSFSRSFRSFVHFVSFALVCGLFDCANETQYDKKSNNVRIYSLKIYTHFFRLLLWRERKITVSLKNILSNLCVRMHEHLYGEMWTDANNSMAIAKRSHIHWTRNQDHRKMLTKYWHGNRHIVFPFCRFGSWNFRISHYYYFFFHFISSSLCSNCNRMRTMNMSVCAWLCVCVCVCEWNDGHIFYAVFLISH